MPVKHLALTLILCISQFACLSASPSLEVSTVVEGATLIDGTGGPPLEHAVVIVRGNRVVHVGTKGGVDYPAGARVIRADGKFLLPGLIDIHVHYHEWQGELHLAHGVTTVKDTGNPVEWLESLSDAINEGRVKGPRLFYTGNSLTSRVPVKDHHVGFDDPETARRAVRILRDHGAVAAKVHQQITPDLLRAIADEAHALGMPVTGHLRRIGAKEAALAGIDGIEHPTGIPRSAGPDPDRLVTTDPENDLVGYYDDLREAAEMVEDKYESLIRLLVERKVAIIPTLVTWFRIASDHRRRYAREDAEFATMESLGYVPASVRELWRTSALYEPPNEADDKLFRLAYAKMSRFLKQFRDAGGALFAGSSTSVMVPGLSLHRELEMMVELGLSNSEAVQMATRLNAEFLRKSDELGTVAVGKLADLILVEASPIEDIRNIGRISLVLKDGVVIDTAYNREYEMPIPRPKMERPVWLERQLGMTGKP